MKSHPRSDPRFQRGFNAARIPRPGRRFFNRRAKAAAFKLCMLFSGTPGAANALAGQNEAACWRSRALRARSARVLTLERHGSSRTAALSPVGAPRSLTALGGATPLQLCLRTTACCADARLVAKAARYRRCSAAVAKPDAAGRLLRLRMGCSAGLPLTAPAHCGGPGD